MTGVELLRQAREKIANRRHWCKHQYDDGAGRYCAVGALNQAFSEYGKGDTDAYKIARHRLVAAVKQATDFTSVVSYNDDKHTTHKDILHVFDLAIKRSRR